MPNLSDSDARTLALRMFYIEVSNGMSAGEAEANVSHVTLASASPADIPLDTLM